MKISFIVLILSMLPLFLFAYEYYIWHTGYGIVDQHSKLRKRQRIYGLNIITVYFIFILYILTHNHH